MMNFIAQRNASAYCNGVLSAGYMRNQTPYPFHPHFFSVQTLQADYLRIEVFVNTAPFICILKRTACNAEGITD